MDAKKIGKTDYRLIKESLGFQPLLSPDVKSGGSIDNLTATIRHFKNNILGLANYLNNIGDDDILFTRDQAEKIVDQVFNLIYVLGRKKGE